MKTRVSNTQTGFTIVELMIVVAVIGVLATIALPIYNDYINRGKVSEAVQLLAGLRIPMQEFYLSRGVWPTVDQIGGKSAGKYTSLITSSTDPNNLYVEAEMRGAANSPLGGKKVRMLYFQTGKDWNWDCTIAGVTNPIGVQYLPSSCK